MTPHVRNCSATELLTSREPGSVHSIITSPPFIGLPGRGDTLALVEEMLVSALPALHDVHGTVTLIVGASPGHPLLPFDVARLIDYATDGALEIHSAYIWDRTGRLERRVGAQVVSHDHILHACRRNIHHSHALHQHSVIRNTQDGFNYGTGVTTPPDLAALLVARTTAEDDLVCDPFAGLGEIGVQAIHQKRRFIGSDTSSAAACIAQQRLAETTAAATP